MPPRLAAAARLDGGAREVLAGHRGYLFAEVEDGSSLAQLLARDLDLRALLPSLFSEAGQMTVRQFALGQSSTGAPWHWHQDTFNTCVVGERVWYLRPPARALMSRQPVAAGVPAAGTSYYAVQRPGDIVYVPELWSHCVVNHTLSVAVALEFGTLMP
mmetsp:Transcript_34162/g.96065  ORF Transcript_34162/g.96065 Transcript_34162/m.96065 type:complete len:158 (+) Transcript_34162:2-475(+)